MTKVIILGSEEKQQTKKPIEFLFSLIKDDDNKVSFVEETEDDVKPNLWKFIELICRDYIDGYDLMYAYDDRAEEGILYMGYFNDGIV